MDQPLGQEGPPRRQGGLAEGGCGWDCSCGYGTGWCCLSRQPRWGGGGGRKAAATELLEDGAGCCAADGGRGLRPSGCLCRSRDGGSAGGGRWVEGGAYPSIAHGGGWLGSATGAAAMNQSDGRPRWAVCHAFFRFHYSSATFLRSFPTRHRCRCSRVGNARPVCRRLSLTHHTLSPASWTSGSRHARGHVLPVVRGHLGGRPSCSTSRPPSCTAVPSVGTGRDQECP